MTVAELHFYELVPQKLRDLAKDSADIKDELASLNKNIEKLIHVLEKSSEEQ